MFPPVMSMIRDRLAPLASSTQFVRSLPERSDNFSEELNGKSVITFYWAETAPLTGSDRLESTDGSIFSIRHVLHVDIRLWGIDGATGLHPVSRQVLQLLHQFVLPSLEPLEFAGSEFEGYSQTSKRWVATLRFYAVEHFVSTPPESEFGDAIARLIEYDDFEDLEISVQSIYQTEPTLPLVVAGGDADPSMWRAIEVRTVEGLVLLHLPIIERLRMGQYYDPGTVKLRTDGRQAIAWGMPATAVILDRMADPIAVFSVGVAAGEGVDLVCPLIEESEVFYSIANMLIRLEEV